MELKMHVGSPIGPYPVPPSPDDERILAAIREGKPEMIEGLAWSKPDFTGAEHKIVRTFAIERQKRPGLENIPCAICSGERPKFLEGAVLWSSDHWLRVIGHDCAAHSEHFGEAAYRELIQKKKQEDLDSAAFKWLEENVKHKKSLEQLILNLKTNALFIEGQQKDFFENATPLANVLSITAQHNNGALTVEQKLSGGKIVAAEIGNRGVAGGAPKSHYETLSLGSLLGSAFLHRPRQKISRQFDGMQEALKKIPEGEGDEPMLALIGQGEHEITIAGGLILRTLQRALKLAEECSNAEQFVGPENLGTLENWGGDTRNTMRFSLRRFGEKVTFILEDRSRATLSTAWPKSPDLSLLNSIVEAGIDLDNLLTRRSANQFVSSVSGRP